MTDFLGQQLGNYRLIGLIGQGGFADVYLGEHIHLGNHAAIKVLKTQVAAEDIAQFRNEARLIVNLKNAHIVPVLDFGIQNGTPFLVMEHAVNGTLRQRHPRGSIVPLDTIVSYVKQVAAALQYAHDRHVIHRDVKPENMLLAPNNEVWLSDFCRRSRASLPAHKKASPPPTPVTEAAILGPAGRMVLGPAVLTIGRQPDNHLVLNDPQVSGHHAEVCQQKQGYSITDLESRNHTFVNGQQLTAKIPRLLNAGDAIRIGTTQMTYEAKSMSPPSPVPPVLPPPLPKPWWQRTREIIAVICAAILILVSIIATTAVIGNNHTYTVNATATAQANNATASTRANNNATATAQANATATFVANPYPPGTGAMALLDPLKDNSKGQKWDEESQGTTRCQFIGGSYHAIDSTSKYYDFCFAEASNFSNFAYQVEMKILNGDCGGLLFRADSAHGNTYIFEVCQDSRYRLDVHSGNPANPDHFLLGFYTNIAIKSGYNQTNVIAIVAKGNTIQMYVNNVPLPSTVNDNTYTQGQIGLLADDALNPTDVVYANMKVWTL